jgi:superfamily II DNA helicase RecQ
MNKERLEWVMSGLNQYRLTKTEDQFVKSAVEDFDQKQMLTERQEERLENLYKEKSKLKPDKNSPDYFAFKESTPRKARVRRPLAKDVLITS